MRLAVALFVGSMMAVPSVWAQAGMGAPTGPLPGCEGSYVIVRLSDIKPGMMEKFKQAAAARSRPGTGRMA